MTDRWDKWRALSWPERLLLLHAAAMLVHARARVPSMRFRPEPDSTWGQAGTTDSGPALRRAQSVARLVNWAAAATPGSFTCLHRSLVTWRLLRQEGIRCRLRLGIADTPAEPFEAHAWVECDGVPLGEGEAAVAGYRPFSKAVVPD